MDSRSFITGLVCGAIIGGLAIRLVGDTSGDEVIPTAEQETSTSRDPEIVVVAPPVEIEINELPIEGKVEESDPQYSIDSNSDRAVPWPENERAKLELEPKDDSWAYYMEQTLLEFLSGHSSISQFDIARIECRTTKCQIEVTGYDESTWPVWQQVMYDIRQQPWNEFRENGSSHGTVDGRHVIVGTFQRVTAED